MLGILTEITKVITSQRLNSMFIKFCSYTIYSKLFTDIYTKICIVVATDRAVNKKDNNLCVLTELRS